ncbi:wax ester/triacylglycerol synthase domain-containing protein [Mycolicibacterium goodii]|uniref:wax ester/triacylglycerol synthase domain-containing protein n=1 Tax=Mycolicibacterium goodii TaxID=134601 RepID=UPI00257A0460|nr:wax ester/triacylglycerol synthase domain-containing protein [Mycolicibacterium goodii]
MAIQTRPVRARVRAVDAATPDNRLSFIDQAGFQMLRATGRHQLMQVIWIYEHAVDMDGLRQFHRNFGYGLAGRRIERSRLPFGRHRWVAHPGPQSELAVATTPRPRAEVSDWADEQVQLPIDPEHGPAWHMSVLPVTDGSTAVSLVASHHIGDGIGGVLTLMEAVAGSKRQFGFPPPQSQPTRRAIATELRQTARDLPELGRTACRAVKLLRRRGAELIRSARTERNTAPRTTSNEPVSIPAISVYVDVDDWDRRATDLGGNSYSLLAGFGAKLGERMNRANAQTGVVTLSIALNERTSFEDTRALAMTFASARVDPRPCTSDLTGVRTTIRQAIETARSTTDEALELLPLIPLVPRRALQGLGGLFFGSPADLPVYCSNLGDVDPAVGRADGTNAEYVVMRGVDQNVTRGDIESMGGQLVLVSARVNGKISIGVVAYQLDAENSKPRLRELAALTLKDFGLAGVID